MRLGWPAANVFAHGIRKWRARKGEGRKERTRTESHSCAETSSNRSVQESPIRHAARLRTITFPLSPLRREVVPPDGRQAPRGAARGHRPRSGFPCIAADPVHPPPNLRDRVRGDRRLAGHADGAHPLLLQNAGDQVRHRLPGVPLPDDRADMVETAADLEGGVAREGEIEYGDRGGTLGPLRGSLLPGALQIPRQGQNFSAYTTGNHDNRSKDESHTDNTQRFPHIPPVSGFFRIHQFFLPMYYVLLPRPP